MTVSGHFEMYGTTVLLPPYRNSRRGKGGKEGGVGGGNLIRLPLSILLCSLRPAEEEERRESLSISHEFGELVAVQVCVPLAAGGRESKKTLFFKKKEVGERD